MINYISILVVLFNLTSIISYSQCKEDTTKIDYNNRFFYLNKANYIRVISNYENQLRDEISTVYIFDSTRCENHFIKRICFDNWFNICTNNLNYSNIYKELLQLDNKNSRMNDSSSITIVFYKENTRIKDFTLVKQSEFVSYINIFEKYFNKVLGINELFLEKYYYNKQNK